MKPTTPIYVREESIKKKTDDTIIGIFLNRVFENLCVIILLCNEQPRHNTFSHASPTNSLSHSDILKVTNNGRYYQPDSHSHLTYSYNFSTESCSHIRYTERDFFRSDHILLILGKSKTLFHGNC